MNTESQSPKDSDLPAAPLIQVSHSPHVSVAGSSSRGMMIDMLLALIPVIFAALWFFGQYAAFQLTISVLACVAAEAFFMKMRAKPLSLGDGSAVVTGIIIALSLPATAPWYVGVIAAVIAIGIGKVIFGGLGMNIFNPAMVGRAFVMISFAAALAASGYEDINSPIDAITQATPLTAFKQAGLSTNLGALFWGNTNGSLGETSALASLLGGLFLCFRKTASWQIPAGIIAAVLFLGGLGDLLTPYAGWSLWHHLFSGAMLFGAFFIATDPVTSPLTPKGKFVFGVGIGAVIMLLRIFSGYPEGVMFAVLLFNALTPLINRWSIPRPFGDKQD